MSSLKDKPEGRLIRRGLIYYQASRRGLLGRKGGGGRGRGEGLLVNFEEN